MPDLLLKRLIHSPQSKIGMLWLDGVFQCFTLELPWKDNQHNISCIPPAVYPITIRYSNRFQRDMPHIENVPNRDGILLHWGNFPKDTDGCVLVGGSYTAIHPDFIGSSRDAFAALFPRLGPGTIKIIEESS